MFQPLLYHGVRRGIPPQRGSETQEASHRADDVGQSNRPLRQRRHRHGDDASVGLPDFRSRNTGDFLAHDSIYYTRRALYAIARPSVCPSVCHTGGSVKNA